jgi:hypothetical protein
LLQDDKAIDIPAIRSNQLSLGHQAILGAFRSVAILLWGDNFFELTADPFTRADRAETVFTATLWANLFVPFPAAFSATADQANS